MNKEFKRKRLEIISKIDSKIKLCSCGDGNFIAGCKNCKEIRKLGEELISLKENSGNAYNPIKNEEEKRGRKVEFHLEVHEYEKLKNRGKSDLEIAKIFGGTGSQIKYWKKQNNIKTASASVITTKNTDFKMTIEQYKKYRKKGLRDYEIAKMKKVSTSYITRWKLKNDIENKPVNVKEVDLDANKYWNMHNSGLKDIEICNKYDVSKCWLSRFKKLNGIVTKKWTKIENKEVI